MRTMSPPSVPPESSDETREIPDLRKLIRDEQPNIDSADESKTPEQVWEELKLFLPPEQRAMMQRLVDVISDPHELERVTHIIDGQIERLDPVARETLEKHGREAMEKAMVQLEIEKSFLGNAES